MGLSNKNKYIKDLKNQRFGSLIAIEPTEKRDAGRCVIWKCQCDCGNIVIVNSSSLQRKGSKATKSCGCNRI